MKYSVLCFMFLGFFCFACDDAAPPPASKAASGAQAPGSTSTLDIPPLPEGEIHGQLDVSAELKSRVKPGTVIFLMARAQSNPRMPLAVAKLIAPDKFPMPFKLTSENKMMRNTSFAGVVTLSARMDFDGDAISKQPGDLVAQRKEPVTIPQKDVVLMFDTMLTKDTIPQRKKMPMMHPHGNPAAGPKKSQ